MTPEGPKSRYYRNLRDYLAVLEQHGQLVRIKRPIDKNTELHPLVRLQFRGLPAAQRRAFLFEHVVDASGQRYDMPVVLGCTASSREIYAIGMQVEAAGQIYERWIEAQQHPIPPLHVNGGPVQDCVYTGADLERLGGLSMLPVPISTPGFDNAPYTTASHWVSRDPESGRYNLGNYRGQIKAPLRIGCFASRQQDMWHHWLRYRTLGRPMPAALVMGVAPNVSYCAAAKLPPDVDEYHVAGGIAREPVELVSCKTVDLEVPAEAEIVVEGLIPTDTLEFEGPFGEFPGYMATTEVTLFMNVTAITHRAKPIYEAFISQFPPSESSLIRATAREGLLLKLLRVDLGMGNVLDVALHESTGGWGLAVIQVRAAEAGQVARIFDSIPGRLRAKTMIVVDDDIDPRDADAVNWAMAFRYQPQRDVRFATMPETSLDPSILDPAAEGSRDPLEDGETRASCLFVDATRKWPYPPTSLPKQEFMEHAIALWQAEGLPELHLGEPWYGRNLGFWPDEQQAEATLAVEGRYYETGAKFAQRRRRLEPE